MGGPGRWAARLVALPSMGTALRPHPRPPSTARPCRSLSLALLHRSCFSLRCACESCSLVFADLPSPSRPSAVPARRELGLCLVAALQFVMLYLRVVPTK